tara:strand:+ start:382 stop:819 length:438 start_codon:yes stop_codon:yes gene_type:complete
MTILSEETWSKHSNKWSGWTRVLLMPIVGVGVYYHSWLILVVAVVWGIVNPLIFPKPKSVDNWMSMGVLGEKIYFKEGKKFKKDLPTLLNILNIPVSIVFVYFGWTQNIEALILSALLLMTIKFWFIDRMSRLARDTIRKERENG